MPTLRGSQQAVAVWLEVVLYRYIYKTLEADFLILLSRVYNWPSSEACKLALQQHAIGTLTTEISLEFGMKQPIFDMQDRPSQDIVRITVQLVPTW